ncbi:MAG: type II secretion system secretin GspD [Arenicellales bacterium]|nr:type II secretion system secretin GspD [Arenicellales bacterium]
MNRNTFTGSCFLLRIFVVVLFLYPGFTTAQSDQPQNVLANNDVDQITLNFQDVDIRALINTVAEVTGRNFIVDPRVKGKVTLVSGGPLSADEIYSVFLSVLEVHNFAAVPTGGIIKVVPSNIVKQRPTPTEYDEFVADGDQQITQVLRLKHASVQELLPILRPLLPPTSHFAAHAPTNTLVFTDTASNINRLLEIIERIDVPDRRASVHVVYLKNAQASVLAGVLSQLATSLQRTGDPNTQQVNISVQGDDAINALIINAPDNEFRLLQAVINQLDIERPIEGDVHVIYLKHAKAADMVSILNNLTRARSAGVDTAAPADVDQTVQADETNNALVIHAPNDLFRTIERVVDQLDVRREQVYVETIIAEVSTNRAADLGIEWQFTDANTPTGQTSGSTEFSEQMGGLTLGYINNLIIDITGNIVPDLAVVLRALRSDTDTNILSTPNLVTLENEPAEIVVAREVPFITGQFTTDVSTSTTVGVGEDVAVNTVNPFQTIERKDVGITLRITPQINAGNTVRLEIEHEISNVSDISIQAASDIITDKRSIQTTVEVDDGQIIVLGGLIRDDVVGTVEWVPILGKIPLVGALFRRKSKTAVKTNLMIFLQPRIVRTTADLVGPTREKHEFIRQEQLESQQGTKGMIKGGEPPVLPQLTVPDR